MQNCVFTGVSYSSPTLASAMGQLIPAFTFLLAVIFRFLSSSFSLYKKQAVGIKWKSCASSTQTKKITLCRY